MVPNYFRYLFINYKIMAPLEIDTSFFFNLKIRSSDPNSQIYIYIYMHTSLKFTVEKESNHQLAFLDVFVHKTSTAYLTSVYRKLTFSGLYTR